jgi:hypothetical protein
MPRGIIRGGSRAPPHPDRMKSAEGPGNRRSSGMEEAWPGRALALASELLRTCLADARLGRPASASTDRAITSACPWRSGRQRRPLGRSWWLSVPGAGGESQGRARSSGREVVTRLRQRADRLGRGGRRAVLRSLGLAGGWRSRSLSWPRSPSPLADRARRPECRCVARPAGAGRRGPAGTIWFWIGIRGGRPWCAAAADGRQVERRRGVLVGGYSVSSTRRRPCW